MTIIGADDYLAVGDNILVDAAIFGKTVFTRGQSLNNALNSKTSFLAQIELISHNFSVDDNGNRSFYTTIQFVRGVFTDEKGESLSDIMSYGIDTYSDDLKEEDEQFINHIKK
jgi:hypothetical protein